MSEEGSSSLEHRISEGPQDHPELRRIFSTLTAYKGPMPPPSVLREYDSIVPGSAARIFAAFESQTNHRHYLERRVINTNSVVQIMGVVAGTLIALLTILGGIWLAYLGKPTAGIAAIVAALSSLVGVFIYGKKRQARELDQKAKNSASRDSNVERGSSN